MTEYYILILLFILVIFFVGVSTSFIPYNEANVFSKEFPYEGFQNKLQPESIKTDSIEIESQNVFGFDGLFASPYGKEELIDPLFAAKGNITCTGKSSGYTDSKGGLCLDDNIIRLFRTRGGNQSGIPSQIGQ